MTTSATRSLKRSSPGRSSSPEVQIVQADGSLIDPNKKDHERSNGAQEISVASGTDQGIALKLSSIDELVIASHNVNSMIPLLKYLSQPRLRFKTADTATYHRQKRRKLENSSSDSSGESNTQPLPLWNPTTHLIRQYQPHVICIQEVKATARDTDLIRALKLVPQRQYTGLKLNEQPFGYTATWSLSHAKKGKNFGVVTYVRDDVKVLSTREVDWDKEGRVVVTELDGVAIYNVYALNGSEFPWNDPQTGKSRGTRNERKREFNRLLMEDVTRQRENPRTPHIILIGDFNISLAPADCFPRLRTEYPHNLARQEFNEKIMQGMQVVDIWRKVHGPEARGYSWFAIGKPHRSDAARVDYALVSEDAVDRVKSIEYLEKDQGGSDHCPLILKYNLKSSL
ncbi:hypothetical protein QFC21_002227 [Naganishia friedmannii]|uniref:Uncharacterized protein n=1 Tax=Naganishia friedmannii TaxID=89922 RepID=A0ACC2VWD0_9TREE|nr:hypothetical protein QFC21_002227 [Naganishia friedmannii]